jgi:hypothetical protein
MNFRVERNLRSVVVCDLVEGKTIEATLKNDSNLSFDLEDDVLRVFLIKRGGAIESSAYSLPDLELSERQYLTFLPAHCSCASCKKPFEPHCNIAVMEFEGKKSVVLCHSVIGTGKVKLAANTCEPLILRVANPVQLDLNPEEKSTGSLLVSGRVEYLNVLDDQGYILEKAFEDSRRNCNKEPKGCDCLVCKAVKIPTGTLDLRGVHQVSYGALILCVYPRNHRN